MYNIIYKYVYKTKTFIYPRVVFKFLPNLEKTYIYLLVYCLVVIFS